MDRSVDRRSALLGGGVVVALAVACVTTACSVTEEAEAQPPSIATIELTGELPSQGRLGGVAVDDLGNVYVSNFGGSLWKVAADGNVARLPVDLRGSSGNHVTPDGRILQASFMDNRVVEIGPDGAVRDLVVEGLDGPVGLTTDEGGRVYVCNCRGNTVTVSEPGTSTEVLVEGGPLDCPNGITWGPDGMLYVVSYNNTVVSRISPATGELTELVALPGAPEPPGQNAHIAFASGRLWVTRIQQGEIYAVGLDGSVERVFGGVGQEVVDGPPELAQLAHPNGVAASPDGRYLYVNDIVGPWRSEEETRMVLRRVGPLPS